MLWADPDPEPALTVLPTPLYRLVAAMRPSPLATWPGANLYSPHRMGAPFRDQREAGA